MLPAPKGSTDFERGHEPIMNHDPILTRAAVGTSSVIRRRTATGKATPAASPEGILVEIRDLIADGDVRAARRLTAEAAERYPNDAEIANAHRILNTGRSYTRTGAGRNTREEFEWLQNPPERYRGKWVALVGRDVVGAAKTLKELLASIPANLEKTPLTVQVAPLAPQNNGFYFGPLG